MHRQTLIIDLEAGTGPLGDATSVPSLGDPQNDTIVETAISATSRLVTSPTHPRGIHSPEGLTIARSRGHYRNPHLELVPWDRGSRRPFVILHLEDAIPGGKVARHV